MSGLVFMGSWLSSIIVFSTEEERYRVGLNIWVHASFFDEFLSSEYTEEVIKIEILMQYPRPTTKKHVRSFFRLTEDLFPTVLQLPIHWRI